MSELQDLMRSNRLNAERAADAFEVAARLAGLPDASVFPISTEAGALVQVRLNLHQAEAYARHIAAHAWCSGRLVRGDLTAPMLGLPDRPDVPAHVRALLPAAGAGSATPNGPRTAQREETPV